MAFLKWAEPNLSETLQNFCDAVSAVLLPLWDEMPRVNQAKFLFVNLTISTNL